MDVKFPTCSNAPIYTLDKLIMDLRKARERLGGDVTVSILMEPTVDGVTVQLEDSLTGIATSERTGVKLLGRSFD